ncbi:hypothetical protein GQ42DRAFT_178433 [Ramicandelaber brevisporus]|nr:hypothetical protein GQ42DRAFT_178433 [Ramicandelaber brevisporus]
MMKMMKMMMKSGQSNECKLKTAKAATPAAIAAAPATADGALAELSRPDEVRCCPDEDGDDTGLLDELGFEVGLVDDEVDVVDETESERLRPELDGGMTVVVPLELVVTDGSEMADEVAVGKLGPLGATEVLSSSSSAATNMARLATTGKATATGRIWLGLVSLAG